MNLHTNWSTVRESSQRRVLTLIRQEGEVSGAALAKATGLQRSTVLYILRGLHENGLIALAGTGTSTGRGGKRPQLWQIATGAGYTLGVEVLGNRCRCVAVHVGGVVLAENEQTVDRNISLTDALSGVICRLREHAGSEHGACLGVGLALPGLVDSREGMLLYSRGLKLSNLALGKELSALSGLAVFMANDANAGALGMKWFAPQGFPPADDAVFLTYYEEAVNLGAGLILGGELYEGFSGTAGEIFTLLPPLNEALERVAPDFPGLVCEAQAQAGARVLPTLAQEIACGCPLCCRVMDELADALAGEICRIIGFVNPRTIYIGGDLAQMEFFPRDYLFPRVTRNMESILHHGYHLPDIQFAPHGKYAAAFGANALILNKLLG